MTRLERYVAALARRRRTVLAVIVALTALAALSLTRLQLDFDLLAQLPQRSVPFQSFRAFLERFGAIDDLVVLVRGEPEHLIGFVDAFVAEVEALPEVAHVRHRVDAERVRLEVLRPHRWDLLDEEAIADVAARLEPGAIRARVQGLRRALAMPLATGVAGEIRDDPLGVEEILGRSLARRYANPRGGASGDRWISPAGDAALVMVRPRASSFDTIAAERLMAGVRGAELAARERLSGARFTVGYTGGVAFALADKGQIRRDLGVFLVLGPGAVALLFLAGFRDLRALARALVPLFVVLPIDFALSLVLFGQLTMLSLATSAIFFGLGIDAAIYFLAALGARPAGEPREQAVVAVLREIGPANVVASTTSAAAFFLIGASDFGGVAQLGIVAAIAMLLNVPATFVLLPALVLGDGAATRPLPPPGRLATATGHWIERLTRRKGAVAATIVASMAVAAWGATRLRLDTDFTHLRPQGGEPLAVEAEIAATFGSLDSRGAVIVDAATLDAALERMEGVVAALDRQKADGTLRGHSSLTAFVPSQTMLDRRRARIRELDTARAADELERALAEAGFRVASFAAAIADLRQAGSGPPIDVARVLGGPLAALAEAHVGRPGEGAALATYVAPAEGVTLAAVERRLAADVTAAGAIVAGRELAESEFRRLLERDLAIFLIGATLANALLLLIAERSLGRALALLLPTLVALVWTVGILGFLDWPVDPVNMIVLPLLLGLGVDHTVYFAAHLREGESLASAVSRGMRPLVLVSGTTVAGFAALAGASYPALASLGVVATVALSLVAVSAVACLPLAASLFQPGAVLNRSRRTDERSASDPR